MTAKIDIVSISKIQTKGWIANDDHTLLRIGKQESRFNRAGEHEGQQLL